MAITVAAVGVIIIIITIPNQPAIYSLPPPPGARPASFAWGRGGAGLSRDPGWGDLGIDSRVCSPPSRRASPAELGRRVPRGRQGWREAGRSSRRRIRRRRRRRRSAAPGGGSSALSPETGPAGSERRRPGQRRRREGRAGRCARLAAPGAPTGPHPSAAPRPAAAPEEPVNRPRCSAPSRQPPPRRPEPPPRARGRWLPAPRAAELPPPPPARPPQVSRGPARGGRGRARRGGGVAPPWAPLQGPGPAGGRGAPCGAHTCCRGGASEEGPGVRAWGGVSPFPAPLARYCLPPLGLESVVIFWGAEGSYSLHPRCARRGQHFRKRNCSGENKGAAQGSRRRQQPGCRVRVAPQCPGPSRPGRTRALVITVLGRKREARTPDSPSAGT